ncbi:MAG: PfkB family carbohydrate kinase [Methanolobus sp.]
MSTNHVGVFISRVFAISETFYDILFSHGKPVSSCPGGAMLNSSVSLGRAGIPVSLISEFASDKIGELILDILKSNNVSTENLFLYEGKSPLSLAFLNENNDAEFDFYEPFPQVRMDMKLPRFKLEDIIMFGSCFLWKKKPGET